jgi:hypothetical protein
MHGNLARFVVPEKMAGAGGVIRRLLAAGMPRSAVERVLKTQGGAKAPGAAAALSRARYAAGGPSLSGAHGGSGGLGGEIRRATEVGVGRGAIERILKQNPTAAAASAELQRLVKETGRVPLPAVPKPDLAGRLEALRQARPPVESPSPTWWAGPPSWWDDMAAQAKSAPALPWVRPPGLPKNVRIDIPETFPDTTNLKPYVLRPSGPPAGMLKAVAGAGALAAGGGAAIKGLLGDTASAVGDTAGAVGSKIKSLVETGSSLAAPPDVTPSSIHANAPTEGLAGTLWRNAPYLAAGGAGAIGLYAAYRQMQAEKQRKQQLPSLNLLPKTASDRRAFIDEFPLVAGFLVACHKAGLSELQFREKVAAVCRLNDDYALEFGAAFEKLGADVFGLPDLTKPLPAAAAAPKPRMLPNAPSPHAAAVSEPVSPQLLVRGPRPDASEGPPAYSAADIDARAQWRQQGSKGPAPLPVNPHWDTPAMTALGTAAAAPLVAGVAGSLPALAGTATTAARGAAQATPAVLKAFPKKLYKFERGMAPFNLAEQVLNPEGMSINPFNYTTSGQLTQGLYQKFTTPDQAAAPDMTPHKYSLGDLPPEEQARIAMPEFQNYFRSQAAAELGPNATPEAIAAHVADQQQALINSSAQEQLTAKPHKELLAAVAKTGVEPKQLVDGAEAAEASGQVDPQMEQQAVENITKETGAPPEPGMWDKLTPGQKWLLGAGVGLAAIGLLTSLTDENGGGLGSTLAAVLGGTMALGAAAHGGMLGEGVQNATKAVTDPLLSSTNMQPVSRDQQQMLAAVRGADLDRYQQLRAGPNPNIPQIA